MKNFVHLHLHTEYSLLDGVGRIEEYIDRAKSLGMSAIAITDHGNMFGAIEFYKTAIKNGIKPIIGIEIYLAEKNMYEKEGRNFHLVLLAKNLIGYRNLLKISSAAFIDGFYRRPRVDKKFLKEHSEGLIALSACMQGEIARAVLDKESEETIKTVFEQYIEIFGKDDFYIEVQGNGIEGQKELNFNLMRLAKQFGVKVVATNDTHYVNKGEHILQDLVICIQTGSRISDTNRMKIETDELYLKNRDEMILSLGNEFIEAIDTSEEIAQKCELVLEFGELKFPHYEIPSCVKSTKEFLKKIVYQGLYKRYQKENITEEILKRLEYELDVIIKMGYEEYFIVVWDFIRYAKSKNIPIGPGRGSAAGSLVAYLLEITELDPLKYNLLFERFLNPERISMPDIDIDICQERREEVIEYVTNKYGKDKVAQIITFGRMKARAAIRDVGRVLDIPISKVDKVAKLVPQFATLADVLRENQEFKNLYINDLEIKKLIDLSKRVENKVRHASIHAAGIVITKDSLTEIIPLYSDKENSISTQYQMKEIEELGLLKMDFLGLRNLTNLQRTVDYIEESTGKRIELYSIPLDEKKVYEMLSSGDTTGVFQLESQGIRKILTQLKPTHFEDIIAVLALYRPGPLGSGMVEDFINCKNGVQPINYLDESLEEILKETYGVILYQEQVMKIANIMANYSLGEADILRRAMGKKQFSVMKENREKFVERAIKNGYSQKFSEEIFDLIDKFAGYGFNKSHSAAYAMIAYWTAYFKVFYPKEYYASVLTSEKSNIENIAYYIEDAKHHKIELKLADVNSPASKFKVEENGIRFSLSAIKNVGEGLAERIAIEYKENGKFKRYEEFVLRLKDKGLNKKNIEALIYAGALDSLPGNRKQKIETISKVIDYATKISKEDEIQQMNLFGGSKSEIINFSFPDISEYSESEKLEKEKEFLGFYYSSHPLDRFSWLIKNYKMNTVEEILLAEKESKVKTFGIIRDFRRILTKKNELMCSFVLEDYFSKINGIIFPNMYKALLNMELDGEMVYIEGDSLKDSFNGKEIVKIIVKKITPLSEMKFSKNNKLFILLKDVDKERYNLLKEIIYNNLGEVPLNFAIQIGEHKEVKKSRLSVDINSRFISRIEKLLGENSVIIK